MKIKKAKAIFFLVLIIIFFLSLPLFLFINKRTAYYSYKEVVYRTIINKVAGRERKPERVALLFLDYFYYHLFTPAEAIPIDKDVYSDLVRGIAWCDQRSWALGTFLGKLGIDNRMVMTRNPQGVSNHTVLEVLINKKWRFLDPTFGFIIRNNNGELLSYEDICYEPHLFFLSPSMLILKEIEPDKYSKVKEHFARDIFYNNPMEPLIWANPAKNRDLKHTIIAKLLDFYICLFGNKFSYFYQDVYLKYFSPSNKGACMFFKARNYDLFNRHQPAIDAYKNLISGSPEDELLEDALFFLGVLYNKTKKIESSMDTLQILLRKYPETKWRRITRYYLGYNCELLNDYESAKGYYWEAINTYKQLEKELKPSELKVARRLYSLLNKRK